MKLLSVCVGRPREIEWQGDVVLTSIFKAPVAGPVAVRQLNLDGDEQSDLTVHGGRRKAVYVYASEHYPAWRAELPDADLSWGAFGENFTVEGLLEDAVYIGDRLSCGTAEFIVTQPRQPCYKLGLKFNRLDMVRRFHRSGRSGFYLGVVTEGVVAAGDEITLIASPERRISVADAYREITG
jgi:MOSC domain-containing protein YiiM